MPTDCMNAYIVVGPTKLHPRFLRSLLSAVDAGVLASADSVALSNRVGRSAGAGSTRQT